MLAVDRAIVRSLRRRFGGLPRQFWVLWTGQLVNRLGTFAVPFLTLFLTVGRGFSVAEAGQLAALAGVGTMCAQPLGGSLSDRFGRKPVLVLSMLASAAVLLVLGYVRGFVPTGSAVFLLGLCSEVYRPAAAALVADLVEDRERQRAYALLFWAVNLGFSAASVAGGALARQGFFILFVVDASTCVLFGVLILAISEPSTARRRNDGPGRWTALNDRVLLKLTVLCFGYTVVFYQAFSTLPLAMAADGLGPWDYGVVIAVNGVLIVLVQPVVAPWTNARSPGAVLVVGVFVLGVGFGMNVFAHSVPGYAIAVAVWTCGEILVQAAGNTVVSRIAPANARGTYLGCYGLAWGAAAIVGPLLGSVLLPLGGGNVLWGGCFVLCAGVAAGQYLMLPVVDQRLKNAGSIGRNE